MITLYRGMRVDPDGRPTCGTSARTLGVRVPDDVTPDAEGHVHPGRGGMSVAPDDPMMLSPHRRPRALLGTGTDPVFALLVARLPPALAARQDTVRHALVEPAFPTPLDTFVDHLHATRIDWRPLP